MDITKTSKKIYMTNGFNNESIGYGLAFVICSFVFLVSKQLLKLTFDISAKNSVLISFVVFEVALLFFERIFAFKEKAKSKLTIPLYLFRCFVDFGFYKIFDFVFTDMLHLGKPLVYLMTGLMLFFFNYYFDRLIVFNCPVKENQPPTKLYTIFFNNRFVLASMLLASVGILFVFCINKLFPFGDMTVMRMDLYHQYGPLFAEFYDRVINHESFLYSWQSGGGSSFLGNYFNYLSSPISLLIFLFDRKQIAFAITTLVLTKGIIASGSFTYYLKESLKTHSYTASAFGVFYAFSGYFLAYYWNIMWIDGMILLPLIALGIERIVNKGKVSLYICSLSLLLYSSYYMGYMCCIFSVLYFVVYYFINHNPNEKIDNDIEIKNKYSLKKLYNYSIINRCFKFGVSSIICGFICAGVLIPVYFILQACSATSDAFPGTFESYFDLLNMLTSHLAGLETTIRSSGDDVLPNIYCGILTAILVPLYYINKDIKLREKALYTLLIIVFIFSFNNNCANFVWHALHFPNDLPYRFSYMYCFIVLIIAFKALSKLKSLKYQDIVIAGMFWLVLILLFQKNPTNKISELTIYVSLAFTVIWTGVLIFAHKGKYDKYIIGITIMAIAFCEVIVGDCNSYVFTQTQENYVSNYDAYTEAIDYTYKSDKNFYRTELCDLDTLMDPSLYGYNGMSAFSSMAYEDYSQDQYSLGNAGNRINSFSYNTQTPVYNMMFGIKYLMYKGSGIKPSNDFYTEYYNTKDKTTTVYKNDYYLPIGYLTSSNIYDWELEENNPFEQQSNFIYKSTGINNVFVPVEYIETETTTIDCDQVFDNGTVFFSKSDNTSEGETVDVTFKTTTNSNLYVYIHSPSVKNVNYYWNDSTESQNQNIDEPYIIDLGMHNIGDEITVSIDCGAADTNDSYFDIYAYSIDKDAFASAYELLKQGTFNIEKYGNTKLDGKIDAAYDGYLFTTIPYDEGWHFYIDGNEVETFIVGNSMVAVPIKHGSHNVRIKYTPKGLVLGMAISASTLIALLGYSIISKMLKKKQSDKFVEDV